MPKIEDVSRPAGGLIENFFRAAANLRTIRQQNQRIEISLHAFVMPYESPRVIETNPPIDADHGPPASDSSGNSAGLPVTKLITGTSGDMPAMIARVYGST